MRAVNGGFMRSDDSAPGEKRMCLCIVEQVSSDDPLAKSVPEDEQFGRVNMAR